MNLKQLVRISLTALALSIFVPLSVPITLANAEEGLGGYAVVHPDGHVCGVIVATSSDPFGNGGTMPIEYMGCPVGARIVFQTKPSADGNVAGYHGTGSNGQTTVTYDDSSKSFTVSNSTTPGNSNNSNTPVATQVTLLIKDGVATDSSGRSFNTGTGVTTNTTLTNTQYADFVSESKRIDSANNEQLKAFLLLCLPLLFMKQHR